MEGRKNQRSKTGRYSHHVHAQFDLGGDSTKIADANKRSIQAVPEDESNTVEEESVAVAEEQVPPNPTVDVRVMGAVVVAVAVAVAEDNDTPVAMDASSTADTILHNTQSL